MARILFEDIFEVLEKDPDGKSFDKGTSLLGTAAPCLASLPDGRMHGAHDVRVQCHASSATATCTRWT